MKTTTTIDEYLASLPRDKKATLEEVRRIIRTAIPGTVGTIAYGMPVMKYQGKGLVGFASFKDHWSLFTMNGTYIESHHKELERYSTTKSAIHFAYDRPIQEELIRKVAMDRMKEIEVRG